MENLAIVEMLSIGHHRYVSWSYTWDRSRDINDSDDYDVTIVYDEDGYVDSVYVTEKEKE